MKALFSIDNDYNQPANNLVYIWKEQPSLEELAEAIGTTFPHVDDEKVLAVVNIWQGQEIMIGDTQYRLTDIKFGEILT